MKIPQENYFTVLKSIESKLKQQYDDFYNVWRSVAAYVRLSPEDMERARRGEDMSGIVHDSTAVWACSTLASALIAFLISPNERWFNLGVLGRPLDRLTPAIKKWIEDAENVIYNAYANPDSNFNTVMHESTIDEVSFGTSIISQNYSKEYKCVKFESHSIFKCVIGETEAGRADTIFFKKKWRKGEILEEYGKTMRSVDDSTPIEKFIEDCEKNPEDYLVVVKTIIPRVINQKRLPTKKNKKYASIHHLEEYNIILKEDGYDDFPYAITRWSKTAEEAYGRGPAWNCISSVRMLNEMKHTALRAAQKEIDPVLAIASKGTMIPFSTDPGGYVFVENIEERPIPIQTNISAILTIDQIRDEREMVTKAFYMDWIVQGQDNVEKTAYQVQDTRQWQFLLLAPVIARIASEKLGRTLERTIKLLMESGDIPAFPEGDDALDPDTGQPYVISPIYISAAARAQQYLKILAGNQWLDMLTKAANLKPEVLDNFNFDEWANGLAEYLNVARDIIVSEADRDQVRADREAQQRQLMEQQQEAMQAEAAQKQANAVKAASEVTQNA